MLTRPVLKSPIIPFDATTDYDFIFYTSGGNQVVKNNLVIEKLSDNTEIYNQVQETFNFKHKLLANTLVNGESYRVKIRTGDINNNWSEFSDAVFFQPSSPPIIKIINIDYENQNRVYNQTVEFKATHSQAENIPLQSYRYIMYDRAKTLIRAFPEKYYNGEEFLTQEIAGLENGVDSYLEVITIYVNGLVGTSGLIKFTPFYIAPKLNVVLSPENVSEQGAIKISANIIQIIGKLYDNEGNEINPIDIEYIDDEWLDLTREDYQKLVFEEGFNISQSDFILKIWFKNLIGKEIFLRLYSPYGEIYFFKRDNEIHAFKTSKLHSIVSHFVSNELELLPDIEYMLYVKSVNNMLDLYITPYE